MTTLVLLFVPVIVALAITGTFIFLSVMIIKLRRQKKPRRFKYRR